MGRTARRLPLQYRLPLGAMTRGAKRFAGGLRDFARAGLAPPETRPRHGQPHRRPPVRSGRAGRRLRPRRLVHQSRCFLGHAIRAGIPRKTARRRYPLRAHRLRPHPRAVPRMVPPDGRARIPHLAARCRPTSGSDVRDLSQHRDRPTNCLQKLGKPVPPQIVLRSVMLLPRRAAPGRGSWNVLTF